MEQPIEQCGDADVGIVYGLLNQTPRVVAGCPTIVLGTDEIVPPALALVEFVNHPDDSVEHD
jgi:hypothetical protein